MGGPKMKIGSLLIGYALGLRRNAEEIQRSLSRLSSGQRLLGPQEDAASFAVHTRLQSEIRGLRAQNLQLNSAQGLFLTAEAALQQQSEIIQRMKELATRAGSEIINSNERNQIHQELTALLQELQRISLNTEFNGIKMLNGNTTSLTLTNASGRAADFEWNPSRASDLFQKTIGNGQFTLAQTRSNTNSFNAASADTGDVNGDGHLDIILPGWSNSTVSVYLGTGNGSFMSERTVSGLYANTISVADLNNDGWDDIIGGHYTNGALYTYLSNGDGTFQAARTVAGITNSYLNIVGDVDNDGDIDALMYDVTLDQAHIYTNDGEGNFTFAGTIQSVGEVEGGAIQDIDGDGLNDIVLGANDQVTVDVYYGLGDGQFSTRQTVFFGTGGSYGVQIADMDGDGIQDLVQGSPSNIRIAYGQGGRSFESAITYTGSGTPTDLQIVDIDNDGDLDISFAAYTVSSHFILNNGNRSFGSLQTVASGTGGTAVGDFDGDGFADFGVRTSGSAFAIYLQGEKKMTGLDLLHPENSDEAGRLIEVLDYALDQITQNQSQLGIHQSILDQMRRRAELRETALRDVNESISAVDYALETAQLVHLQIKQQARIAALTQAQAQASVVLRLLGD